MQRWSVRLYAAVEREAEAGGGFDGGVRRSERRGARRLGPPVGGGAHRKQQPRRARVPAQRGLSEHLPFAAIQLLLFHGPAILPTKVVYST